MYFVVSSKVNLEPIWNFGFSKLKAKDFYSYVPAPGTSFALRASYVAVRIAVPILNSGAFNFDRVK
jgi:hypothetical protein